jgi:Zn-dependent peptidase ImmA (M78 family)/transcriptional regulator with XRE-family HTH domain
MAERATGFNPEILRWARERAGLSLEEAGARVAKPANTVKAWEEGKQAPTYLQLETLAEKAYKRPIALFFFPDPPNETPPSGEFRTVPEFDLDSLSADTRYLIRDAHAYLASIRELTGGANPAARVITRDIRASLNSDLGALARKTRKYLGISLETQQSWRGATREAMSAWREAVEAVGVYVFKRSFKQREVAGFCLFDRDLPLIVVNNSTPFTRQIFTLFHELAHLLFGISTIDKTTSGFIDRFTGDSKAMEIACNHFAAEFLVPSESFKPPLRDGVVDLGAIADLAALYSVSREVILRRLLDRGDVGEGTYTQLVTQWAAQPEPEKGAGGNYYATQATYLGNAFLRLAFGHFHGGKINLQQLSEHLDIRSANIGKLEAFLTAKD